MYNMNDVKYIFIDDESNEAVQSIIHGLNDTGKILIEQLSFSCEDSFESLTEKIKEKISTGTKGILVDLCLNGEGANSLTFTASPLAQHIRTLASVNEIPHLPMVLCSTDERLRQTYDVDNACHDLYDYRFVKSGDIKWEKVSTKMAALVDGYSSIHLEDSFKDIIKRENLDALDSRIFDRISSGININTYDYSRFIIKDLFQHSGPLIKETVLAARLGIDIEQSQDWDKLLELIEPIIKYKGVFSSGWKRYWADLLDSFFKQYSGNKPLSIFNAKERVEIIKHATEIEGLKVASPIEFCTSSYYNTICEALKKPIDSLEAYEVYESYDLRPWQEAKYVSFYAIASGKHSQIPVKSSELDRFKQDQKIMHDED